MKKQYLMGLDAGGGAGRCLLADAETGEVVTAARAWSHPTAPGTSGLGFDVDTKDVWAKLGEASRECLARAKADGGEVAGIAVTSMRNTTVLLDEKRQVIFAAPNRDARALGEAMGMGFEMGKQVHAVTGHWPSPLFTGSRLVWLRSNAKDVLDKTAAVLSLSDYVAFLLCGRVAAERTQAGETLLFDQASRSWAADLIASLEFPGGIFPELVDSGARLGELTRAAAEHLGLKRGIPVTAGGADTQCGLLGAGAVEAGDLGVIAGTTMPVQLVTPRPVMDGEGRLWSGQHVVPGLCVLESNGLTTGEVLDWFARILFPENAFPVMALDAEAERSEPGACGVYSTLGVHVFDGRTIGIPVGNLSLSHMVTPGSAAGRRHLCRAVLEGLAYSVNANLEQIKKASGREVAEVRVTGGMSKSPLWTRMVSEVTGARVIVPAVPESSALGAAVCAGCGAGTFRSLAEGARRLAGPARVHDPGPESGAYRKLYDGWKEACGLRAPADACVSNLLVGALMGRPAPEAAAGGTAFRPRIKVTAEMDESALRELGQLGEVSYESWREKKKVYSSSELVDLLAGHHVFVTELDVLDREAVSRLPDLRLVVTCRGTPVNVDIDACSIHGVAVANTPGRNADAVADLVVAFMIMLARRMPGSCEFLKKEAGAAGDMERMARAYLGYQGNELWRKTVGLVGLGSVGAHVAKRLAPFGARVLFHDPHVSARDAAVLNAGKVSLVELLERSDFVSLHAPAGPGTEKMMDDAAFARMKKGAFLINTARAALVDEGALVRALESGRLGGAALDVFSVEPPSRDDPLVSHPRVIVTPHLGGNTVELAAHQGEAAVRQIALLLKGQAPEHLLNREVLDRFTWTGPRREPTPAEIEKLKEKKGPSMTS